MRGMWSGKTTLPLEAKERTSAIAAALGNDAYLGMGVDANGNVLRDFWKYNVITHRLTRLADFPFPALKYPEFVRANSKFYLLGGDPGMTPYTVSYTHLTLPTSDLV